MARRHGLGVGRRLDKLSNRPDMIGEWMVLRGWAVAYVRYSDEYTSAEAIAKARERGIWEGYFKMPWEWRKMMRGE